MVHLCFAYYCSGHGYGHATRVSALVCHLLSVPEEHRPTIYIVSSAPRHIFADSIACGAFYRYAKIDPVIVQPLAYRVDRQKSVQALKTFLDKKDELLELERRWLLDIKADAVLSDAAFLGCLAAKSAGIPSILITNFTFDSVYSYLSTPLSELPSAHSHLESLKPSFDGLIPDIPVPPSEIGPLVDQIYSGYRCADLLLLLPGFIPIPSFFVYPPLPSYSWIDTETRRLLPDILDTLKKFPVEPTPCMPFSFPARIPRMVIPAPLLVRPPRLSPSVYTSDGRSRLLSRIGVPSFLHDPDHTKVLIVSFGGQVFRRPSSSSRQSSRSSSRSPSPVPPMSVTKIDERPPLGPTGADGLKNKYTNIDDSLAGKDQSTIYQNSVLNSLDRHAAVAGERDRDPSISNLPHLRLATPSHIWIPGAPPTSKPRPSSSSLSFFNIVPPTPAASEHSIADSYINTDEQELKSLLFPDNSWIAIVCGISKEQWLSQRESIDEDSSLPNELYVAPQDVYMPDLTAVGDVLLGKLGYGTVSECVDACTPFVYVSRPLFIEEHGLRMLLESKGTGVEMSRECYEEGDWASCIQEAWTRGSEAKARKREQMVAGGGVNGRQDEGKEMAGNIIEWVKAFREDNQ